MMTIGSILIGVALGLRFNVLSLVPTLVLALVSTAAIGIIHADHIWPVAQTMVLVTVALQIGYFVGTITRAAVSGVQSTNIGVAQDYPDSRRQAASHLR